MKIGIVMYPGVDELDVLGPYEVLVKAKNDGAAFDVVLCNLGDTREVEASHGARLVAQQKLEGDFAWLIVAGGRWASKHPVGCSGEIERGELPLVLAAYREQRTPMAAVCTGTMLLAAAKITNGRTATTHHVAHEALRASGAIVVPERVVHDGDLVTAGGVTSGIDLGLYLVERWFGEAASKKIGVLMEYPPSGGVHRVAK